MDYQKIYNQLVERGQNRSKEIGIYYESHHILPRCMGGGDEKENLTNLTAREHYIAHWLLYKIHPDNFKLSLAFWGFINIKSHRHLHFTPSSRIYEALRVEIVAHMKDREVTKKTRDKISKTVTDNYYAKTQEERDELNAYKSEMMKEVNRNKTPEEKQKQAKQMGDRIRERWSHISDEERELESEWRRRVNIEHWKTKTDEERKEHGERFVKRISELSKEEKEKRTQKAAFGRQRRVIQRDLETNKIIQTFESVNEACEKLGVSFYIFNHGLISKQYKWEKVGRKEYEKILKLKN